VVSTPGSILREGKVDIKWGSNDKIITCRRGFEGKVDVEAVEAAFGGTYKPEWLPCLKVLTNNNGDSVKAVRPFSVDDCVIVDAASVRELKEKQADHGGWVESMAKVFINIFIIFLLRKSLICFFVGLNTLF